jgi:hypothetical protein
MWQRAAQIFAIPVIRRDRFTIPTIELSSQLNITVAGTFKTERNTKKHTFIVPTDA